MTTRDMGASVSSVHLSKCLTEWQWLGRRGVGVGLPGFSYEWAALASHPLLPKIQGSMLVWQRYDDNTVHRGFKDGDV